MAPQMFKALLFLKVNECFWNQILVIEVLGHAKIACLEDCFVMIMEQLDVHGNNK
jgi:hypothetical protein